jgi:hypothetical protein
MVEQEPTSVTTTEGVDISLQATEEESASGMQIEIPYVPESQRKTMKVVKDSVRQGRKKGNGPGLQSMQTWFLRRRDRN